MLKIGMLVELGALLKGEIEKLKRSLLQHLKWKNEIYEIKLNNSENSSTLEC